MAIKKSTSAPQRPKAPVKARTTPKKRTYSARSKKPSFFQSLFSGKREWVVAGVFLILFGGIGTYMLRPSSAVSTAVYCGQYSSSSPTSNCVKYIQRMINGTNYKYVGGRYGFVYYTGGLLTVDGSFGPKTKAAVIAFQKSTASSTNALKVDGVVGTNTWDYLCYRVNSYKANTIYPLRTDAYNAGKSAGCQGSGWPVIKVATTTTTSSSGSRSTAAPVAKGIGNRITSCMGPRNAGTHWGVDVAGGPSNQSIFATNKGYVVARGYESNRGNYIVIRHDAPDPYDSWYQHLSSFSVSQGQKVNAGTKIGNQGSTGNSTGPHLHYNLSKKTSGAPSKGGSDYSNLASESMHMKYMQANSFKPWGGSAACTGY
ncbi:MAG: peptidoglycan DD-metalloendopeptidase family protein [Candidatus Saccharimonadales bacterium]